MENPSTNKGFTLVDVIGLALQIPGVKVNREAFLREQFKKKPPETIDAIIQANPIEANCGREELRRMARALLNQKTLFSSLASFAAGIPGGVMMAVTIPADLIQFYSCALTLAQEIAYLYGEPDLWGGESLDNQKVMNQLILYCGVMLGASGATQLVKVMSAKLAQQALKVLPRKALTKTFYYPIIKSIAKSFGARMTRGVFAKGVSIAIPIVGGVVSGGITLATLPPMGMRLIDTLEDAHFSYTPEELASDLEIIAEVSDSVDDDAPADDAPADDAPDAPADDAEAEEVVVDVEIETESPSEEPSDAPADAEAPPDKAPDASPFAPISSFFGSLFAPRPTSSSTSPGEPPETPPDAPSETSPDKPAAPSDTSDALEGIARAKRMLDDGVLTQDEFAAIKAKLIAGMK